jgi:hypothetical protein
MPDIVYGNVKPCRQTALRPIKKINLNSEQTKSMAQRILEKI